MDIVSGMSWSLQCHRTQFWSETIISYSIKFNSLSKFSSTIYFVWSFVRVGDEVRTIFTNCIKIGRKMSFSNFEAFITQQKNIHPKIYLNSRFLLTSSTTDKIKRHFKQEHPWIKIGLTGILRLEILYLTREVYID